MHCISGGSHPDLGIISGRNFPASFYFPGNFRKSKQQKNEKSPSFACVSSGKQGGFFALEENLRVFHKEFFAFLEGKRIDFSKRKVYTENQIVAHATVADATVSLGEEGAAE